MSLHWTYREPSAGGADLEQGDIIWRNPDLLAVLKTYHSYFCDNRYTGFAVISQTCDLVRRSKNPCNAKYIALAVIRELDALMPDFLAEVCGTKVSGIYDIDRRPMAVSGLSKIINQNDQGNGFFYLHPVTISGREQLVLATRSLALLRVSISLRREHYDLLLKSRVLGLAPSYAAKLGWLVGNLYSRVPTPDWEDQECKPDASRKVCEDILDSFTGQGKENWVAGRKLKLLPSAVNLESIPRDRFASEIANYLPPSPLEQATSVAAATAEEVFFDLLELETVAQLQLVPGLDGLIASMIANQLDRDDRYTPIRSCISEDKTIAKKLSEVVAKVAREAYCDDAADFALRFREGLENCDTSKVRNRIVATVEKRLQITLQDNVVVLLQELIPVIESSVVDFWTKFAPRSKMLLSRVKGRLQNEQTFKRCLKE
jgi:hypothetical protein